MLTAGDPLHTNLLQWTDLREGYVSADSVGKLRVFLLGREPVLERWELREQSVFGVLIEFLCLVHAGKAGSLSGGYPVCCSDKTWRCQPRWAPSNYDVCSAGSSSAGPCRKNSDCGPMPQCDRDSCCEYPVCENGQCGSVFHGNCSSASSADSSGSNPSSGGSSVSSGDLTVPPAPPALQPPVEIAAPAVTDFSTFAMHRSAEDSAPVFSNRGDCSVATVRRILMSVRLEQSCAAEGFLRWRRRFRGGLREVVE